MRHDKIIMIEDDKTSPVLGFSSGFVNRVNETLATIEDIGRYKVVAIRYSIASTNHGRTSPTMWYTAMIHTTPVGPMMRFVNRFLMKLRSK